MEREVVNEAPPEAFAKAIEIARRQAETFDRLLKDVDPAVVFDVGDHFNDCPEDGD